MPIRSELLSLYPPDWRDVSLRVRFVRAQGRCERCRRPHGWVVYQLPDGRWFDAAAQRWISGDGEPAASPAAWELLRVKLVQVQLSTAHIDHDPANNDDSNLAAWCQRCHLIHDAPHHLVQRRITFLMRRAIGDLFSGPYYRR